MIARNPCSARHSMARTRDTPRRGRSPHGRHDSISRLARAFMTRRAFSRSRHAIYLCASSARGRVAVMATDHRRRRNLRRSLLSGAASDRDRWRVPGSARRPLQPKDRGSAMTKYTNESSNFGADGPLYHIIREGLGGLVHAAPGLPSASQLEAGMRHRYWAVKSGVSGEVRSEARCWCR